MAANAGLDTIGIRLAQVADRLPDKIAIVEREAKISFGQLDKAATTIAQRIRATDEEQLGRVGLFFDNKLPAIKAIFGAGRSGHAYVPLDAGDPEDRLRFILQDSEPVALLTEGALSERAREIVPTGCAIIDIEDLQPDGESPMLPDVASDAPVYLYYTSGSTGQPKGVIQTHRNLLFFADAYAKALRIGDADRLSLLYTLSFNAANMDIFGGLPSGATLCAYGMRRDGIPQLADWLDRERITVLHAVPTVFRELAHRLPPERLLPHLRAIDLGGESVFASDVELFRRHTLENCVLVNQLAATEAGLIAQHVVAHRGPPSSGSIIPVGRCPQGVRVEIRRDDGSAADIDEVGQMIICSPHVSPGYWRRPELDAAAFSVDPQEPGGRHYASGDFGHIDEAGNLHFLGRKGSRVKIRGHSVELMEIEAALAACPGVTKAAVLAKSGETQAESVRLTAYVATRDKTDRDPSRIRRNLATRLPPYMLPAAFVFVDALPLTASGKIDRNALALLETTPAALERKIEPLQDDVERTVAEIFEQLLKLAPVGRGDDFFTLGGDSLLGVELQVRLGDAFGVHVANFHEDATVARIAANIRRDRAAPSAIARALPVLVPLWRHGNAPPLFLVHGRHGQAFVSPHFMQLLGDNQPVWVFQARGLDGLHAPHSNVEDMAAEYLAEMREERPHGPYFLGALCAGAYIAAAMARALREAGESVLPLLLLDPPDRMLNGGYSKMTEERFVDKMVAKRAMGRSMGPVGNPTYMKAVVRTAMAFEDAIVRHRPQPYDGPVYLLSSRRRIQRSDSSELRKIFTGRFKRFEVGDTHAEALDPRNPVFVSYLLRCVGLIREAAQVGSPAVKVPL
jgi:amino acid adenylation domain-containing protein